MTWFLGADFIDIAGRVYVDLADPSTQNYFYDPESPPSDITGRVPAGPWVKGLMGLLPGTEVYSYSEFWRGKFSAHFSHHFFDPKFQRRRRRALADLLQRIYTVSFQTPINPSSPKQRHSTVQNSPLEVSSFRLPLPTLRPDLQ